MPSWFNAAEPWGSIENETKITSTKFAILADDLLLSTKATTTAEMYDVFLVVNFMVWMDKPMDRQTVAGDDNTPSFAK